MKPEEIGILILIICVFALIFVLFYLLYNTTNKYYILNNKLYYLRQDVLDATTKEKLVELYDNLAKLNKECVAPPQSSMIKDIEIILLRKLVLVK